MVMAFGREICCNLDSAESREWLVTNGIGGYASGTIANLLTRHYHGLLVAALKPPLGRTLMLAKLDETAVYDDRAYPLYTNRWADGTICTAQAWTVAEVLRAWLLVLLRAFHGGPAPVMDERNSFSPSPPLLFSPGSFLGGLSL